MRSVLLISVTFFLIGCGGGGIDPTNFFNAKEVLLNNSWYESCGNLTTKEHKFTNSSYILTKYSDDNFEHKSNIKSYPIISYDETGFEMKDNNIVYKCITSGAGVNSDIDTIIVNCASEDNSTNFKLFMANKTKELAKSNSHQCFDF